MLPPLPRCSSWVYSSLISPRRISLPRFHYRVGLHIVLFEVCSAFTRVAACTLAQVTLVTAIRGLQTFRHLHACPGCFRLERSPGGPRTHWKSAALSRRTWKADIHTRTRSSRPMWWGLAETAETDSLLEERGPELLVLSPGYRPRPLRHDSGGVGCDRRRRQRCA